MRKTNTEAKSIDHDNIKGPRRKKPTKRYELWWKTKRDHDPMFQWVGKWMKFKTYEEQEHAIAMGEKLQREVYSHNDYKVIDKITQEIVWQSASL